MPEKQSAGAVETWLALNPPSYPRSRYEQVGSGAYWIHLRTPEHPLLDVGFKFESDGMCSGVAVQPARHGTQTATPSPFSSRLLRTIKFGDLEQEARKAARRLAAREADEVSSEFEIVDPDSGVVIESGPVVPGGGLGSKLHREALQKLDALSDPTIKKRPGRKKTITEREIAQIASAYVKALSSPDPVAEVSRVRNIAQSTARNRISEARKLGLLTPTAQGKSGGELTAKAKKILKGTRR